MSAAKRPRAVQIVLVLLLLAGYVFFTYSSAGGVMLGALGTIFIVICASLAWPERYKEYLGLIDLRKAWLASLALILLTGGIAFVLIRAIAAARGIGFGLDTAGLLPALSQIPFQTLNEELVLGALLLLSLRRRFRRPPSLLLSFAAALAFSLLHLAFYAAVAGENRGPLTPVTLASLFLAGLIRNNFILYQRSVWAAWAVHIGWNAVFLGPFVLDAMNEPTRFNIFLGSYLTLAFFAALLAASSLFLFLRRKKTIEKTSKEARNEGIQEKGRRE
ncbi:MAG: CPBP family intramembrane metalloprotease [Spirochaetales bacterium]|nr:CPBP family intramembrane metalloprotease [Spirochaetales bacterium]